MFVPQKSETFFAYMLIKLEILKCLKAVKVSNKVHKFQKLLNFTQFWKIKTDNFTKYKYQAFLQL